MNILCFGTVSFLSNFVFFAFFARKEFYSDFSRFSWSNNVFHCYLISRLLFFPCNILSSFLFSLTISLTFSLSESSISFLHNWIESEIVILVVIALPFVPWFNINPWCVCDSWWQFHFLPPSFPSLPCLSSIFYLFPFLPIHFLSWFPLFSQSKLEIRRMGWHWNVERSGRGSGKETRIESCVEERREEPNDEDGRWETKDDDDPFHEKPFRGEGESRRLTGRTKWRESGGEGEYKKEWLMDETADFSTLIKKVSWFETFSKFSEKKGRSH